MVDYHQQQSNSAEPVHLSIEQVPLPKVMHYPYHIVATDGSQIYPDRHEGVLAYLVHAAAIVCDYRMHDSVFSVVSKPEIFAGVQEDGTTITAQEVDEQRTRSELELLAELAREYALIDGPVGAFKNENILYAGYISKPRARDLVRALKLTTTLCDAELLEPILVVAHRTQFQYSPHAQCYYAYIRLEQEIARVEIPEHIAQDAVKVDLLIRMIVDQCNKGNGYPITLAQAHEAAVVTAADRTFFYDLLRAQNGYSHQSLKLRKKLEII